LQILVQLSNVRHILGDLVLSHDIVGVMQMVMGLVLSLLLIAFGAIFQLSLFLHNSFGILFFLLFLFQLSMASFAFLCSIFVRKV